MFDYIQNFDQSILNFIRQNLSNEVFDKIMPIITFLGNVGVLWIIITLVLMSTKKYRKAGLVLGVGLLATTILGEGILKHLIERSRPFVTMNIQNLLVKPPITYSFPSGHTSSSIVSAYILSKYFKNYRLPIWIMAILIAFSRLYLMVHYPTDVIAGAILGLICGKIVVRIMDN